MILTEVKSNNTQDDSVRLYEKATRLPALSTKTVQFPMLFASVFFWGCVFFPFFRFLGCFLPERHEAGATASLGALLPTPRHRQRRQPRDLRHVRGAVHVFRPCLDVVVGRVDVVLPRRHATSGATRTSTSTVPMAQMSQMSERGEKLRDRRSRIRHRAHRMT